MFSSLLVLLVLPQASPAPAPDAAASDLAAVSARIDSLMGKHWQEQGVQPAGPAPDHVFLRRLTLDLAGRIPTAAEAQGFAEDRTPDKRARAIRRLLTGPEYPQQLGRVLDEVIQGKHAGDAAFLDYLRGSLAERRSWDRIFREILLGPWDAKESKGADRFLARRVGNLDDLTNDTAVSFFGINVSCAKCHDHPLVEDWKQDHYFGMVSFFKGTHEASKGKNTILEKDGGEVQYVTTKGERRSARVMFLSGRAPAAPAGAKDGEPKAAAVVSRRAQLVEVALQDRTFFSRAVVNRLWDYFFGRGLVHPVDQLHSANPASVPGLLEFLADDLADHGYDLDRLVGALVSSRAYQQAGTGPGPVPADKDFARAQLRPLTPAQLALSLHLAAGDGSFDQAADPAQRLQRYRELESRAAGLARSGRLDPRTDRFQSSAGEALYMANHADVQRLLAPEGKNLAARLLALDDAGQRIDTAFWAVLSRPPTAEERSHLAGWLDQHRGNRERACSQVLWALATSAEFRFNH